MSALSELLVGLLALAAVVMINRWTAGYDIQGWLSQSAWRLLWSRDFARLKQSPRDLIESDPILRDQVLSKTNQINADRARLGTVRTAGKHGALFALAFVCRRFVVPPLLILSVALIGHASYRWFVQ